MMVDNIFKNVQMKNAKNTKLKETIAENKLFL